MKRLLYLITLPELGGAQAHVLELLKHFRNYYDVHFATSGPGWLTNAAVELGIKTYTLPSLARSISIFSDIQASKELGNLLKRIKPDLIHAHSSKAGFIARISARFLSIPVVFTAHGWGFKPGVPNPRRLIVWLSELFASGLTERIICVSNYDRLLAQRHFLRDNGRIITIHNGLSDVSAIADPSISPPRIVMTARFQEPKEQNLLLRSFAMLNQRQQATLTFVGSGPRIAESQLLAQELGVSEQVAFLGDRNDVANLLQSSQIFVLLSRYEGLPISILEAMRAGLPIIASNVGGVPEQIQHNLSGILVPNEISQIADALQKLISNIELRTDMGQVSRQRFLNYFSSEKMLNQTEQVYAQILRK